MKKEDLMIGDWVNIQTEKDDEPMYSQVEQLWECEIDADFQTDYKNVHPIPLSKEILEKNGFHLMHGFRYNETYPTYGWGDNIDKKYISVDVTFYDDEPINGVMHLVKIYRDSMGEDGVDSIHSCHIDYVHELQHALKVCKIEKEIVL